MQTRRAFLATCASVAAAPVLIARAQAKRFEPAIGVCCAPDRGALAKAAGCSFIEVSCRGQLVPEKPDDAFGDAIKMLRATPIPALAANSFLPGSLRCTGPDADHSRVMAYASVAFERAARAGIGIITFGSSGARSVPGGYPIADAELQLAALLARLGDMAARHAVVVSLEPLQRSETNFINTVEQGLRLVNRVGHPSVGLTADIFHMLREGEGPEVLRRVRRVRHVHVAEKRKRTPPGYDGDDFTPYLQALKDAGYDGAISLECRWSDLSRELPVAVQTMRKQIAALT